MGIEGAIAAILSDPRAMAALSIGMDVAMRNLLRDIAGKTEEELEAFISQKKAELMDHETWLRDRIAAAKEVDSGGGDHSD